MSKRVIFYYQTFCGLKSLLKLSPQPTTHIHLSSIHFGLEKDRHIPYIHLNNSHPDDNCFNEVWKDITEAHNKNIKIVLMIGGEGGAYNMLFSNYNVYYSLLKQVLNNHHEISGIDLDIEEDAKLENILQFVSDIKRDYPNFIITFAPIASTLQYDSSSMAGFSYKELYNKIGNEIEYFNGQFYEDYTYKAFKQCVDNGYPANKIVMGMLNNAADLDNNLKTISTISRYYPDIGGAFVWEYFEGDKPPEEWSVKVNEALHPVYPAYSDNCNIS